MRNLAPWPHSWAWLYQPWHLEFRVSSQDTPKNFAYINNTLGKGCNITWQHTKGLRKLWATGTPGSHNAHWFLVTVTRHHPLVIQSRLKNNSKFHSHLISLSSHWFNPADLRFEHSSESPGGFVKPGPQSFRVSRSWGWICICNKDHILKISGEFIPQKSGQGLALCQDVKLWRTQISVIEGLAH